MSGFDLSRVTWYADHIWVNWEGSAFSPDTVVSLDVEGEAEAQVPDAGSSLLLLGIGLVGLGAWRRQQQ
jgi:hypothetical protein